MRNTTPKTTRTRKPRLSEAKQSYLVGVLDEMTFELSTGKIRSEVDPFEEARQVLKTARKYVPVRERTVLKHFVKHMLAVRQLAK